MLAILIILTLLAVLTVNLWRNLHKYPKGPTPLPLIGNLHQLVYATWKAGGITSGFNEIRKTYGNVFTLWFGPMPTVHIADYDVAHETHVKRANVFGTRHVTGGMNYIREGRGILESNGEFWQDHRRFALQTLRNFGLGRNIMEGKIMEELKYRLEDYQKSHFKNGAIEVHAQTFSDLLVGSVINKLLTSERFEQNDKKFEELKRNFALSLENFTFFDAMCPLWLIKSKWMKWRTEKIFAPFNGIYEVCHGYVQKRIQAIEKGEHVIGEEGDDFIDAFLVKMEKDKREGLETTFNRETMVLDMYDLWIGGQETTSTTLTWAFACLLNSPDAFQKARNELIAVTGGNRSVSLTDRTQTPYLNALISEIQRIASIMNFNFFRDLAEDVVVDGQFVAAGTKVTTQMTLIHKNEKLFEDHEKFRPERFIENSSLSKKLLSFGIGKRVCPGESLAMAEMYLIIGNIIMNFDIEPVGTIPAMKTVSPFSVLNRAPNYMIRFVPRPEST